MADQTVTARQSGGRVGKRRCPCHACEGKGFFAASIPSCRIRMPQESWIVVERCDSCERFEDDLMAALSRYAVAGWFQCQDGGWHAIADSNSRQ